MPRLFAAEMLLIGGPVERDVAVASPSRSPPASSGRWFFPDPDGPRSVRNSPLPIWGFRSLHDRAFRHHNFSGTRSKATNASCLSEGKSLTPCCGVRCRERTFFPFLSGCTPQDATTQRARFACGSQDIHENKGISADFGFWKEVRTPRFRCDRLAARRPWLLPCTPQTCRILTFTPCAGRVSAAAGMVEKTTSRRRPPQRRRDHSAAAAPEVWISPLDQQLARDRGEAFHPGFGDQDPDSVILPAPVVPGARGLSGKSGKVCPRLGRASPGELIVRARRAKLLATVRCVDSLCIP